MKSVLSFLDSLES